jgi:hypothetical protein
MMRQTLLLSALVSAWALAIAPAAARQAPCEDAATHTWIAEALDSWTRLVRTDLRLETRPVPWIVAFDAACVWHVNPDQTASPPMAPAGARQPLPLRDGVRPGVVSARHDGAVRLPDGRTLPPTLATFVAPYGPDARPFLVTALPPIWGAQERLKGERHLPALIRGVFMHEMTHTLQSSALGARIDAIASRHALPDLTDDVIQDRFSEAPGFREAFERERNLFYAAAAATPAARVELGRQALEAMVTRRSRYLSGTNAHFAELEDVFLIMEGAANWTAYRSARADGIPDELALPLIRRDGRRWSQDEGLGVFLFLEAADAPWRADVFSDAPSSIIDLVRLAVEKNP